MSLRSSAGPSQSVLQLLEDVLPRTHPGAETDVYCRTIMAALQATPVRLHKAFPNFQRCNTTVGRFPDFYSFLYSLRGHGASSTSAAQQRYEQTIVRADAPGWVAP